MSTPGLAANPNFKILAPREIEDAKIAEEKCKKAKFIQFFLHGFVLRIKGEVEASANNTLKKIVYELAKLLRIIPEDLDDSSDYNTEAKTRTYFARFLIAGFKSLQMRIKLKLGDAAAFLEGILENDRIKFGDVYDLVDALGKFLEESEFIRWYDNVPWIHEFVTALHQFAFADLEIGLVHKNFSSSIRMETVGIQQLFDLSMMGMQNDD